MSISTTFKKVGSTIKETFKSKPSESGMIMNIFKANARVKELEQELENKGNVDISPEEFIKQGNFTNKAEAISEVNVMATNKLINESDKNEALAYIKNSSLSDSAPAPTPKKVATTSNEVIYDSLYNTNTTPIPAPAPDISTSGLVSFEKAPGIQYSKVQPHFFVKYNYYLLYDNGICYLQLKNDKVQNYPMELVVLTSGGVPSAYSIMHGGVNFKFRNMSQKEYSDLVRVNVSIDTILSIYQRKASDTVVMGDGSGDNRIKKVILNLNNVIPVF